MTDIEQKALALVNEVATPGHVYDLGNLAQSRPFKALLRAIERHEAFRQEVSEAVVATYNNGCSQRPYVSPRDYMDGLRRFIIAKPDPLVEVLKDAGLDPRYDTRIRAAIEKRGGKIVWGEG